jgi:pimeloyl-ACP methyl ester carboxylesterase
MVGLMFALRHPARVHRVVTISGAAAAPDAASDRRRAQAVRDRGLVPLADAVIDRWVASAAVRPAPPCATIS